LAPGAAPPAATPLTAEEFAARIAPLHRAGPLALAVSGGSDSMALMTLTADWAAARDVALLILTVDHGLREGAAEDAAFVEAKARGLGLPVQRLEWLGEKPATGVQAAAREARYRLMSEACREAGIGTLALAHTMDDQAETVLMRLARGAGVDGLSAMAAETDLHGLRLIRPLLDVSRAGLRATLSARGHDWRDDPTNEDASYERVRARSALKALSPLGVSVDALARTAARMGEAREALDAAAADLAHAAAVFDPMGYVRLAPDAIAAAPRETALRLVSAAIRWVSGAAYAPGREELARVCDWIAAAPKEGGRTLHGCQFDARAEGVTISREPAAATEVTKAATGANWDGRFQCRANADEEAVVAALGAAGARTVKEWGGAPDSWARAPRAARLSTPALWRGEDLLSAPFAGFQATPDSPCLHVRARSFPFSLKGSGEDLC